MEVMAISEVYEKPSTAMSKKFDLNLMKFRGPSYWTSKNLN
jgi:hypothetical protein